MLTMLLPLALCILWRTVRIVLDISDTLGEIFWKMTVYTELISASLQTRGHLKIACKFVRRFVRVLTANRRSTFVFNAISYVLSPAGAGQYRRWSMEQQWSINTSFLLFVGNYFLFAVFFFMYWVAVLITGRMLL